MEKWYENKELMDILSDKNKEFFEFSDDAYMDMSEEKIKKRTKLIVAVLCVILPLLMIYTAVANSSFKFLLIGMNPIIIIGLIFIFTNFILIQREGNRKRKLMNSMFICGNGEVAFKTIRDKRRRHKDDEEITVLTIVDKINNVEDHKDYCILNGKFKVFEYNYEGKTNEYLIESFEFDKVYLNMEELNQNITNKRNNIEVTGAM